MPSNRQLRRRYLAHLRWSRKVYGAMSDHRFEYRSWTRLNNDRRGSGAIHISQLVFPWHSVVWEGRDEAADWGWETVRADR